MHTFYNYVGQRCHSGTLVGNVLLHGGSEPLLEVIVSSSKVYVVFTWGKFHKEKQS